MLVYAIGFAIEFTVNRNLFLHPFHTNPFLPIHSNDFPSERLPLLVVEIDLDIVAETKASHMFHMLTVLSVN